MPTSDFCCVPSCSVSRSKDIGTNDKNSVILFHTFPKEPSEYRLRTVAVRRDAKEGEFDVRRDTCVCSYHFEETGYVGGKKNVLDLKQILSQVYFRGQSKLRRGEYW